MVPGDVLLGCQRPGAPVSALHQSHTHGLEHLQAPSVEGHLPVALEKSLWRGRPIDHDYLRVTRVEVALQRAGERRATQETELEVLEALQVAHAAAELAEVAERRAPEKTLTNI